MKRSLPYPANNLIKTNNIETLNIAEPRESQYKGMYALSYSFLEQLLAHTP